MRSHGTLCAKNTSADLKFIKCIQCKRAGAPSDKEEQQQEQEKLKHDYGGGGSDNGDEDDDDDDDDDDIPFYEMV
jgi:hypothetical protein